MVSAGMGFDAAVCCAASASRLRGIMGRLGLGKLFCFLLGLCQAAGCRSSRGYILLDGVKKVEFNHILFISCHIQPSEGGGFVFAPRADGSDGRMNVGKNIDESAYSGIYENNAYLRDGKSKIGRASCRERVSSPV